MKIQDIGFLVMLVVLLLIRRDKLFFIAGLMCFILAIPLFSQWVFFTAERLTWYGAGFMIIGIIRAIGNTKENTL